MKLTKRPHRLCASRNRLFGRNRLLADLLPEDLEDYFGDIIQDTALLSSAYVEERYTSDKNSAMNRKYPAEFPDNAACAYNTRTGRWRRLPANSALQKAYGDQIKDKMELTLLTVLDRIARQQSRIRRSAVSVDLPLNRMAFLQGGIGSGKTTLLHHFHRVLLPKLDGERPHSTKFFFAIIDFNNVDIEQDSQKAKNDVIDAVRTVVEKDAMLESVEAWGLLARPELYDEAGCLRPAIATSANPEREKRRIIHRASNSTVFLQRASRHIAGMPRPGIPVIVYDNLDSQPVLRQLAFIRHLQHLLTSIPSAIGVVSVRERTLGHLCSLGAFMAFGHLKKMHMTTPVLPDLIQKRFDRLLATWDPSMYSGPEILISERASISEYDLREILAHISSAFLPRQKQTRVSSRIRDSFGHESVDEFLHNATNSNARQAISLVVEGLQSWALRYERPIRDYVVRRDLDQQHKLAPIGVDELVRLAAVGQWRLYDHGQNEFIQNVFGWGSHMPNSTEGRFPLLLVYRMLQFFVSHGDHVPKARVYGDLRWLGYRQHEISELLEWLIDRGFVESYEGPCLDRVSVLYTTRKTWFYFHFFSKMLVYLEHMRNDSMIEYEANPHDFDSDMVTDAHSVFEFIEYVLDQEEREYAFVRTKKKPHLKLYKKIVADQPLSWKLLRSVTRRLNDLATYMPNMFPESERPRLARHCRYMKAIVLGKAENGDIWPPTCPGRGDVRIRFPIAPPASTPGGSMAKRAE